MDCVVLDIFEMYLDKKISIYDLQNRLSTVVTRDTKEEEYIRLLDNKIEKIIYCSKEENYFDKIVELYESLKVKSAE